MNLFLIKIGFGVAVIEAETWEQAVVLFKEKTSGIAHAEISPEKGNISQIEMSGEKRIVASSF